jgi:hypothetical protein
VGFDTGIETPVTSHDSSVIRSLIEASQAGKAIEIFYRTGSALSYFRRELTPKSVFSASRNPGVIYMRALADGEEKLFRADKVAIWDVESGEPKFSALPECNKLGCHNSVEYQIRSSTRLKIFEQCQSCRENRGATRPIESNIETNVHGRPICINTDCRNLAEIKETVNGHTRYGKTCTSCRKKKYASHTTQTAESPRKVEANIHGRPICSVDSCRNLAEIKETVNGHTRYGKTCTSCRKKKYASHTTQTTESPRKVEANIHGRPICSVEGCDNLAELKSMSGSKPRYGAFCAICRNEKEKARTDSEMKIPNAKTIYPNKFEADPEVDHSFMSSRFREMREKLLDFSRRNPLINFSHSERGTRFIRAVDEVPDELKSRLIDGVMTFKPLPDFDEEPADEKSPEFQSLLAQFMSENEDYLAVVEDSELEARDPIAYQQAVNEADRTLRNLIRHGLGLPQIQTRINPDLREHARAHNFDPSFDLPLMAQGEAHQDDFIQTLMVPDGLDRRLRGVYQKYQDFYRETGINILQIAFGFLEWTESQDSERKNVSPILLMSISMERKKTSSGYIYEISAENDRPDINDTLVEKLKSEFGLQLPQLEDDESLGSYFGRLQDAISEFKDWRIRSFVTLGLFPFTKISIFNDLFPEAWGVGDLAQNIDSHEAVARLLGGKESNETSFIDEIHDIDHLTARGEAPPLVMEADSSQHSAIYEVFNGQSLVIQGPPGTGKSQTITNLIAAAISAGKRVLFVAEKKAALDVVGARLKSCGLGSLMIEPSTRSSKTQFLESLKERLEMKCRFDPAQYETKKSALIDLMGFNERIKGLLGRPTNYIDFNFFNLVWRYIKLKFDLSDEEKELANDCQLQSMNALDLERAFALIERFVDLQEKQAPEIVELERFPLLMPNSISVDDFVNQSRLILDGRAELAEELSIASDFSISALVAVGETLDNTSSDHHLVKPSVIENELNFFDRSENLSRLKSDTENVCRQVEGWSEIQIAELDNHLARRNAFGDSLSSVDQVIADNKLILPQVLSVSERLLLAGLDHLTLGQVMPQFRVLASLDTSLLAAAVEDGLDLEVDRLVNDLSDLLDALERIGADFNRISIDLTLQELAQQNVLELEQHLDAITTAGLFGGLSSKVGRAKTVMKDLGLNPKSEPSKHRFTRFVALAREAQTLADDKKYARLLGRNFKGVSTDTDFLASLIKDLRRIQEVAGGFNLSISNLFFVASQLDVNIVHKLSNMNSEDSMAKVSADIRKTVESLESVRTLVQKIVSGDNQPLWPNHFEELKGSLLNRYSELGQQEYFGLFRKAKQLIQAESEQFSSQSRQTALSKGQLLEQRGNIRALIAASQDGLDEQTAFELSVLQSEPKVRLSEWTGYVIKFINQFKDEECANESIAGMSSLFSDVSRIVQHDVSAIILAHSSARFRDDAASSKWSTFFDLAGKASSEDTLKKQFEYAVIVNVLKAFASQHHISLTEVESGAVLKRRESFRQIDNAIRELEAKRALYAGLNEFGEIPRGSDSGPKKTWTDLKLIQNELGKKRGHIPIRQLLTRARNALIAMKPVWLMTPVAVSQYLPKKREMFDLVIIDEASQMLPESAVASILRGKQLVVVGDDMQMPPSQGFMAGLDYAEDDEPEVDSESILELASNRLGNTISLRWHYRSRHESLINFSNRYFYEDRLEVFPSPRDAGGTLGVTRVKVDGSYKQSVNVREAEAVIVQLKRCMADYPDDSIGVVAMNAKQAEFINEQLDMYKDTDPVVSRYFDRWNDDPLNFLFVRNLENVQGDERDTIIISTVYGPDDKGNMYQRFPLINTATGHRRLNVLFSRAKNRVILVTSMNASDVKLEDRSTRGKKALRDYIEYAGTGRLDAGDVDLMAQADSDFELHVMERLKVAGYEPVPQVGVRGFRIDIGVRHPNYPDGFIAGIECDGATYHSSPQARDRDKIRQDILQSLGWKIYRIWSTDWFSDPLKETDKMLNWLNQVGGVDKRRAQHHEKPVDSYLEENVVTTSESSSEMAFQAESVSRGVFIDEPSGTRRQVDNIDGPIHYYTVDSETFDVWNEGRYNGWVERKRVNKIESATFGSAMSDIAESTFIAEASMPDGENPTKEFRSLEQAVGWVFKTSKDFL